MKYSRQVQANLERLDRSLLALNKLIREGRQQEAIEFMENGALKDAYEELQNIFNLAQTGSQGENIGARGTTQTGTF